MRGWGEVVGAYRVNLLVRIEDFLVDGIQDSLTEENYRAFFALAVEVVVRPWEKYIMGMKFTEVCLSLIAC